MNALKHGMASRQDVVPGEDARELDQRLDSWLATLLPKNPVERRLVEVAVKATWRVDRVMRVQAERAHEQFETAQQRDVESAAQLGERLFHDSRGPTELHGLGRYDHRGQRTSWSGIAPDPDDPTTLVLRIASTAAGVNWLLTEWRALGSLLEIGTAWQAPDKLKALRLMGYQPLDVLDVRLVLEIFLASAAIDGRGDDPFTSLKGELDDGEYNAFVKRVRERWTDMLDGPDPEEARRVLVSIVERAIGELTAKAAVFEQNAERDAVRRADILAFDDSPTGRQLRKYEESCHRTVLRSLSELSKFRRAAERAGSRPLSVPADIEDRQHTTTEDRIFDPPIDGHLFDTQHRGLRIAQDHLEPTDNEPDAPTTADCDPTEPTQTAGYLFPEQPNDEPNEGDGHPARQQPLTRAATADTTTPDAQNVDNEPNEADGHLARQQPLLKGDGHLARQQRPLRAETPETTPDAQNHAQNLDNEPNEADGHLARQQPLLGATTAETAPDAQNHSQNLDNEPNEADGHLARQQPLLEGHLARQRRPLRADDARDASTQNHAQNLDNEPNEGDGHPARQQPLLGPATAESTTPHAPNHAQNLDNEPNEGDGHLARQQPLLGPATAESTTPHAPNHAQNLDNEPNEGDGHLARQQPCHSLNTQHRIRNTASEPPGLDDLKTTILRELCRREVKPTSGGGDVSHRQNRRSRRDRGAMTERGFRKPRTFDLRVGSPILASLPPVDFSRLLTEAHYELEKELL